MSDVVIVGIGLIGASLGLALRAQGMRVTGVDLPSVLALNASAQAADRLLRIDDREGLTLAMAGADVTILATPVSHIVQFLPFALQHASCVTDCGSTKRWVSQAASHCAQGENFVPGHPMAGLPGGGGASARADLFIGRTWLVCPELASASALARVKLLIAGVGAKPLEMSAEAHDSAVALTSHLPQILGSAMKVLAHERSATLAAGPSFERLTRAAGGADNIWRDIFTSNGDEVARALRALIERLEPLACELETQGPQRIEGAEGQLVLQLLADARSLA